MIAFTDWLFITTRQFILITVKTLYIIRLSYPMSGLLCISYRERVCDYCKLDSRHYSFMDNNTVMCDDCLISGEGIGMTIIDI